MLALVGAPGDRPLGGILQALPAGDAAAALVVRGGGEMLGRLVGVVAGRLHGRRPVVDVVFGVALARLRRERFRHDPRMMTHEPRLQAEVAETRAHVHGTKAVSYTHLRAHE